jgi:hypothetical protein
MSRTGVIALFPTVCSVRQWESTSHNVSLASGQHKWGWQEEAHLVKCWTVHLYHETNAEPLYDSSYANQDPADNDL